MIKICKQGDHRMLRLETWWRSNLCFWFLFFWFVFGIYLPLLRPHGGALASSFPFTLF
ncbi:hypothetical protein CARUB_v10010826mg [Capsella rubella]|uniref:Uncharacterized protein n=1 Tax=Capsella rubella TaxID=81985 RepID=R0GMS7_9BRAS|nr:hypothetical protein CARUB_v10010826mg [Capsella rubella]